MDAPRPLDGVRVLDLGQIFMGPYCGLVLAYLGADVVKVEPPGGENVRSRSEDGNPPAFQLLNANKRDLELDLKAEAGKQALKDLVAHADVLIENFRPGAMERLGLGYETLREVNPELVYGHGSGYGDGGPYAGNPAMDLAIQARGGVMSTTGFPDGPPVRAGPAVGDMLGGIHLTAGVVSALYRREHTGEGEYVDVGMMDCIYPTLASPISAHVAGKDTPPRTGNRHAGGSIAPYNAYEVEDGHVVVMCITERHWEKLTEEMGRPELAADGRFDSKVKRADRVEAVDDLVQGWVDGKTRAEVVETLLERDVPCAPVQTVEEVIDDPQLAHRGMVNHRPNRSEGRETVPVPGSPIQFAGSRPVEVTRSPELGEHAREVLAEAGYTAEELDDLDNAGVI